MSQQRGIALIMVLVILALATIIATQLISMRNMFSYRTQNVLLAENAWGYAVGAENLAKIALHQALKNEDLVHLGQPWASQSVVFPIDGGQLTASLKDMRACFNINMLATVTGKSNEDDNQRNASRTFTGQRIFVKLLQNLPIELTNLPDYEALSSRLRDWIDADQIPSGFEGREDEEYSGYIQPYRSAGQLMVSVSEIRTVSGFEPELVELILPYLCAIPNQQDITINVNTIPVDQPELLSSFYDNLSLDEAASILSSRPENGFDEQEYSPLLPAEAKLLPGASVQFSSQFFAAIIEVELGGTKTQLKSLLFYDKSGPEVQLLARLGHND